MKSWPKAVWQRSSGGTPLAERVSEWRSAEATSLNRDDALRAKPDTLHGLFDEQLRRAPAAVAAVCGDDRLSYRDLDRRARAVTHQLIRAGVRRGALVALCVERSLDLAVGLLGIAKAGAAYVPLDPTYPADRLAFALAETEVQVVLTQRRLLKHLPPSQAHILCCDEIQPLNGNGKKGSVSVTTAGSDLAYVMYTSGSTGQPKGVMIEHEAVVNTIVDVNQRFAVGPTDSVLALSSCTFDLSVYDMFGLWAAGGCVVLPGPAGARDPAHWARLLRRHQVTIWNSVPSSMEMLLAHQSDRPDADLNSLRLVLLSGDWIALTLPDRVRAINPGAQLVSLGGATEASIWSILYPIGPRDPSWRSIPYGRAMLNQSMHVLDEKLTVCPPGTVGHLYIGGVGLARGYWKRPELTTERFIEVPLGDQPPTRLYATGDMGRVLPDGAIEFLGRNDGQVKIRGYRIELGEVESALSHHPSIRQATVLVCERRARKQLVAYYVTYPDATPTSSELRGFLEQTLPEYMVPTRFVMLDQMPLTSNGKIDRQALSSIDQDRPAATHPGSVGESERRLMNIWQEDFGLESIGLDDDFFTLGGDSVLAASIFARIEREFSRGLSFDTLLQRPTIRLLAALLKQSPSTSARDHVVQIQAGDIRPPLFCLPGIGGSTLGFRALAERLDRTQAVYGLAPLGFDDDQAPHDSIAEMAAHAIEEMRLVQPDGPYCLAGYSLGGVVAFEMAQQLRAVGQTTALLALLDSQLWSPPVALSILQKARLHWRNLYRVSQRERLSYLRERWRVLSDRIQRGSLRHVDEDLVTGLDLPPSRYETARVHWHAWRSYKPRVYAGQITLFVAERDPELSSTVDGQDPTLGWARWTSKPVQTYLTCSTHADILRARELQALSTLLGDAHSQVFMHEIEAPA
jgi:amino acid adenylation domain-containing protein